MTIYLLSFSSYCFASQSEDAQEMVTIPKEVLIQMYQDMNKLQNLNEKILKESKISKQELIVLKENLQNSQEILTRVQTQLKESRIQLQEYKSTSESQMILLNQTNQNLKNISEQLKRKDRIHQVQRDIYLTTSIMLFYMYINKKER